MNILKKKKWIGAGTGLVLIAVVGLVMSGQGRSGAPAPQSTP